MTQDEIIEMAREAGFRIGQMDTLHGSRTLVKHAGFDCLAELTRLVRNVTALVEAKATSVEREACAQVCDAVQEAKGHKFYGQIVSNGSARQCATAIRARGQA